MLSALPSRWLGVLGVFVAFLVVAAWPLRDALQAGAVAGSGPDVTVSLWGMWWFSEEWWGPAWHGVSTLANFPTGTVGTVLAPLTSAVWAGFAALAGPRFAVTLTDLTYLVAWCATVAWLARVSGVSRPAALVAGGFALAGRYLVYAVGETSIVGVTALPAAMCVIALLEYRRAPRRRWLVLFAGSAFALGLEFPYLVPLVPVLSAAALVERRQDTRLRLAVVAATVLLWVAVELAGRGQVTFGSGRTGRTVPLFGMHFPSAEDVIARATFVDQLRPAPVRWSGAVDQTLHAGGREYVGLGLLLAALGGAIVRPRRALPWLGAGLVGMVLASGSSWGGVAAPFALVNSVAAEVVRPLTQPTRFLVLPAAALPVAAAHLLDHLGASRRWAAVAAALGIAGDALAFGGLSLRVPVSILPAPPCVTSLQDLPRTAVLTLPWDGLSDGDASIHSREWQVAHGQAGPVFGVGSWTLVDQTVGSDVVARLGVSEAIAGKGRIDGPVLLTSGYTHVVADTSVGAWLPALVSRGLGPPTATCAGAAVWTLSPASAPPAEGAPVDVPAVWTLRASKRPPVDGDRASAPLAPVR